MALMERCIGTFPPSLIDRSKRAKDFFQRYVRTYKLANIDCLLLPFLDFYDDTVYDFKAGRHLLPYSRRNRSIDSLYDRNDMVRYDSLSADSKEHVATALTVRVSMHCTLLHSTLL